MNQKFAFIAAVTMLAASVLPVRVAAQNKSTTSQSEKSAVAKARALFQQAQLAYSLGEFQKASDLYTEAYKLKPLPGFLFNIAQCYKQLGDYRQAAFAFGRFVDASKPGSPNLADALVLRQEMLQKAQAKEEAERKSKLEAATRRAEAERVAAKEGASAASPANTGTGTEEIAQAKPWYKKWWVWTIVGAAVAGGAAGAAVGLTPQARATHTPSGSDYTVPGLAPGK